MYQEGCPRCQEFKGKSIQDLEDSGTKIITWGRRFEDLIWIVKKSEIKAVSNGEHYIFTVINAHIGYQDHYLRTKLTYEAVRIGYDLAAGAGFRLIENFGAAGSEDHFHIHIIIPQGNDRLPKGGVNWDKFLTGDNSSEFYTILLSKGVKPKYAKYIIEDLANKFLIPPKGE